MIYSQHYRRPPGDGSGPAAQGLPYYLTAGADRKEHLMNIHATHEKLAAKGAPFDFPPIEMPGGTQALFRDPDGNGLVLSQRR